MAETHAACILSIRMQPQASHAGAGMPMMAQHEIKLLSPVGHHITQRYG